MAHHANNQHGFRRICFGWIRTDVLWYPKLFSHRVFLAEDLLRENIIDNCDELIADAVLVVEEAAFEQRNAHYLQVVWGDAGCQSQGHLIGRRYCRSAPIADLVKARAHWDCI